MCPQPSKPCKPSTSSPCDVVITDVRLTGGMSGLELLGKLRRLYPNLRSILVSAYEDSETMAMARELGVYHCFRKPFAFDEFTGVVANALREAAMELNPSHLNVDWSTQVIHRKLTDLMRDTGAQCVLLTKNNGAVVARVGDAVCLQGPWPIPTTSQGPAFNFAYQQGKTHDVYSADVGQDMRLSLAFDRNSAERPHWAGATMHAPRCAGVGDGAWLIQPSDGIAGSRVRPPGHLARCADKHE